MLEVRSWRITYADGSTFDSTQGTWADAPAFGLTCVIYYHVPPYQTLDNGGDDGLFYFRGEGDYAGLKMGLWMDETGYYRLIDAAGKASPP